MSARSSAKSQPRVSPRLDPHDGPAPVVVVVVGCGLADVAARDPPDLGTVRHVQHPGDAAKLEPAVWERFVGDDDGHPRLACDVLELAVASGHPEGEPAVLPDVPDGGKHDRCRRPGPWPGSRGDARRGARPAARRIGHGSPRHPSSRPATIGRWRRRRGSSRSSSRARASASSRFAATTWPISSGSPSTRRSGSGRSWARRTQPACAAGSRPRWPTQEAGTERPFATIDVASGRAVGSSRFMTIVPEHKRLEIGWTWIGDRVPAHRRQPRGQAAPADPRLRDARREPGRVQDACPQRAVAQRAGGDRRDVRGGLPQPHDHARRLPPRLGLLQRDRRGVAGGQGRPRRTPRPLTAQTVP